jgi:4-diphosphocytidyl-2-C-methyl-D-erythritol kinase
VQGAFHSFLVLKEKRKGFDRLSPNGFKDTRNITDAILPISETAFAKVNLALHVRGRRSDGYHRIETLFAFCEDGDRLSVAEGDGLSLEITGPFAGSLGAGDDNLVLRAARALAEAAAIAGGARLTLDKRLPVAAGLGGGSADAAAALRLLDRWWGAGADEAALIAIAARLGADVPARLASRTARGEGRGDELRSAADEGLAGAPLLLVNPGFALATAAVFAAWDGIDRGPLGDWREGRNDLEPAAIGLAPAIAVVLDALQGAPLARMSGSGATCFALFERDADRDRAAAALAAARPEWWLMPTRLRG